MNDERRKAIEEECKRLKNKIGVYESRLMNLRVMLNRKQTDEDRSVIHETYDEIEGLCWRCYEKLNRLSEEIRTYVPTKNEKKNIPIIDGPVDEDYIVIRIIDDGFIRGIGL